MAAGGVDTASQIGTALGVAALVTLATGVAPDAPGTGYTVAFLAAAALAGATALGLVCFATPRARAPGRR